MNSRAHLIRRWVADSFSGRALALGAAIKLLAFILGAAAGQAPAINVIDGAGDVALAAGALTLVYHLFNEVRRVVLWRVRRKLIVSYIFIGFVPALLIVAFVLLSGLLLLNTVGSYMVHSRITALTSEVDALAALAATDLRDAGSADGPAAAAAIARRQAAAAQRFPGIAFRLVPAAQPCGAAPDPDAPPAARPILGPLEMMTTVPAWVPCEGIATLVTFLDRPLVASGQAPGHLAIRAVHRPAANARQAVLVDLPLNGAGARLLRADTGVELRNVSVVFSTASPAPNADDTPNDASNDAPQPAETEELREPRPAGLLHRPIEWVAFFETRDWETGRTGSVMAAIRTSVADMYERLAPVERVGSFNFGQLLLLSLAVVAALFLVIQALALVMGLALARSITGSVHELFIGTERVQRGDFTHKIAVRSHDQLGQLADSFNSMTGSIEDLLRQKEEKERMEQELRIARQIQMSLLPQGPATLAGLALAGHCEPAREVGGDYYDYLPIDDTRLGVLIADVSGKGTSAALYMAELKGVMLALSQQYTSPRALLIEANRLISRHLDTRSFITITYAVIDVAARTLTYARAGHCPLIYVPGGYATDRGPQILSEGGMVLGLQLDTGDLFEQLLPEIVVPLGPGDLFLFYTDGLSEAMNPAGDCFGDDRLGDLAHVHADLPFDELRERIRAEIQVFVGEGLQHDDMTLLLARIDDVPLSRTL